MSQLSPLIRALTASTQQGAKQALTSKEVSERLSSSIGNLSKNIANMGRGQVGTPQQKNLLEMFRGAEKKDDPDDYKKKQQEDKDNKLKTMGQIGSQMGFGSEATNIASLAATGSPLAAFALVKKRADSMKEAMGKTRKRLGNVGSMAMEPGTSPTKMAGETLRAGGEWVAGDPIIGKHVFKPMYDFAASMVESVDRLREWTDRLHQANIQFAEFSTSMTRVQVQEEIRSMNLSRERGERRAGSAEFLAESRTGLNRKFAAFEDIMGNIQNYVGGILSHIVNFVTFGERGVQFLEYLANAAGMNGEAGGASQWLWEEGDSERVRRMEQRLRPRRFQR